MPAPPRKQVAPATRGYDIAHIKRCMRDMAYYARSHLVIIDKAATTRKLNPNAAQRKFQEKITKQIQETGRVRAIVLKARQEGLSTWTAARFFRRCHLWSNVKAMIIAHQQGTGAVLFGIYNNYFNNIPDGIVPPRAEGEKGQRLALVNGSQIVVETARDATAGRAITGQLLHISEMAFWENPETVWLAVQQGFADIPGTEIIVESTANGVGNLFHKLWVDAEAGVNDYVPIFLPWWIHEEYELPKGTVPRGLRKEIKNSTDPFEREAQDKGIEWEGERHKLPIEKLAWRRRTIANKCAGNLKAFQQEYPATAREAFIVSGSGFFDSEALEMYERGSKELGIGIRPFTRRGTFVNTNGVYLSQNERGHVRIWQDVDSDKDKEDGASYVIGADTALGRQVALASNAFVDEESERGGRDFNSADVVRIWHEDGSVKRKQVAHIHGRMHPEVFAEQLAYIGHYYSIESSEGRIPALLAVEKNHSSGETVLRHLKHTHNYPNLYYGRLINRRYEKPTPVLGWVTTKETRMPMLDELAQSVREFSIDICCEQTIGEMYTFVRQDDGKPEAQEGAHDDRVISLAIALQVGRLKSYAPVQGEMPEMEWADSPTGWS